MQGLNKDKMGVFFAEIERLDNDELPLYLIKSLKQELVNVFKKYMAVDEDLFVLKVKVLNNRKYVFMVDCLTDFLMKKYDI